MKINKKAFTVIELLLVMVVIIILAGLFFNAFKGASRSALKVSCASNIRSIVKSLYIYTEDYPEFPHPEPASPGHNARTWYGCLYYLQDNGKSGGITDMSVYVCPATKHTPPEHQKFGEPLIITATNANLGYYNPNYTGSSIDYWVVKPQQTKHTILFELPDLRTVPATNVILIEASDIGSFYHHADGRNLGYMNGSVKFITSTDSTKYPVNLFYDGMPEEHSPGDLMTVAYHDRYLHPDQ